MKPNQKLMLALLAGAVIGATAVHGLHAQAKPPAYLVTEVEIINQDAFKEYVPKVGEALQAAGARFIARSSNVTGLEGTPPKRVVIQAFENIDKAQAWRTSDAWKNLAPLREKAVKIRAYIVEGL